MNVASLQKVALALAESQTVDSVLQIIVGALAEQSEVALARVWLKGPGDICTTCEMKSSCPDQQSCLHLVASAGNPLGSDGPERSVTNKWTRIDGDFRRIPLNAALEVGKVGGTGQPLVFKGELKTGSLSSRTPRQIAGCLQAMPSHNEIQSRLGQ